MNRFVVLVWSLSVVLVTTAACQDKERASREIERLCAQTARNREPGSGVPWYQGSHYQHWAEAEPYLLAHEAVVDYGVGVQAKKVSSGRPVLTAQEHEAIFTDALTKRGLRVPECKELMAFNSQHELYLHRIRDLYPLCGAYDDQVTMIRPAGLEADDHDRVFKEVADKWREEKTRQPEALELVDKLLAMGRLERGQRIRVEIETYMTGPGLFGRCRQLVWDAEMAAGLRVSSIK